MANETETGAAVSPSSSKAERVAKIGTVISAILASSCCWLPLLLLAIGVSGAGIASTLGAYRVPLMVVTFGFLAMAFYFTYRPRRAAGKSAACCASQEALDGDCCAPRSAGAGAAAGEATLGPSAGGRRVNMMALNKVMLWVVTVLAVAFLFFPKYFTSMLGPASDELTADMARTVLKVEGMTCEGCVPPAARAIRQVPGVLAVKMDYPTELATVGTRADQPVPRQEILSSLKAVGFSGEFIEPSPSRE